MRVAIKEVHIALLFAVVACLNVLYLLYSGVDKCWVRFFSPVQTTVFSVRFGILAFCKVPKKLDVRAVCQLCYVDMVVPGAS